MADINGIAEQIQGLTLLEASQLVKLLEEKLGVSAAAASVAGVANSLAPSAPVCPCTSSCTAASSRRSAAAWENPQWCDNSAQVDRGGSGVPSNSTLAFWMTRKIAVQMRSAFAVVNSAAC